MTKFYILGPENVHILVGIVHRVYMIFEIHEIPKVTRIHVIDPRNVHICRA